MKKSSNIKDIMKEKKISCLKLMEITGLSNQTVANARGSRISDCKFSTLEKIAVALGVRIADLYTEVEN